jgi:hypothetical protein
MDPVRSPVCQNPLQVIAVIDDPRRAEGILRHLGAWHALPAGLHPPCVAGPSTYEPFGDGDPTLGYENVLTD